jgi:hypothetical protein
LPIPLPAVQATLWNDLEFQSYSLVKCVFVSLFFNMYVTLNCKALLKPTYLNGVELLSLCLSVPLFSSQ